MNTSSIIKKSIVDEIIQTAKVEEVVADFVGLKKKGVNYTACCPFHSEKTPSFIVSPAKNIYKCFGCGEAGNPVSFLMSLEKLTYPQALEYLAKKYGIKLEYEENTQQNKEQQNLRQNIIEANDIALNNYKKNLIQKNERNIALEYLYSRGLTKETIGVFNLGYSKEYFEKDNLIETLEEKPKTKEKLLKAGILVNSKNGIYDRFTGRIIFPIYSASNQIIGFGGRIIKSNSKKAKYLNSAENEVYNKSSVLYGFNLAKNHIAKNNECYLVEGYLDVISMHQTEIKNTVATCGTALTVNQLLLISRFTKNLTIVYDSDDAGKNATEKAIELALKTGFNIHVVSLKNGEDPDSICRTKTKQEVAETLQKNKKNYFEYLSSFYNKEKADKDPYYKIDFIKVLLTTINLVRQFSLRTELYKLIIKKFDITQNQLNELLKETNKVDVISKTKKQPVEKTIVFDSVSAEIKLIKNIATNRGKEIIKIFLTCFNEKVEHENKFLLVHDVLINEIKNLDLNIKKSTYKEMYELIVENKDKIIRDNEFYDIKNSSNIEITKNYAEITFEDEFIKQASKRWEKYGHFPAKPNYYNICRNVLLMLKHINIISKIIEYRDNLKNSDQVKVMELLKKIDKLNEEKHEIANILERNLYIKLIN